MAPGLRCSFLCGACHTASSRLARNQKSLAATLAFLDLTEHYVNATFGFRELGGMTHKSPKSLTRMLGAHGNPQARNLFEIIRCLQEREGLRLEVRTVR